MSGFPRPVDLLLTAPLELPAAAGKPLTTQGGSTVDGGTGDMSVAGNVDVTGFLVPTGRTPALAANPPVSGTVYENTSGSVLHVTVPLTGGTAAGTGQWALGPTSTPGAWGGAETVAISQVKNMNLVVPPGWYWSITAGGTTAPAIGSASAMGF